MGGIFMLTAAFTYQLTLMDIKFKMSQVLEQIQFLLTCWLVYLDLFYSDYIIEFS